MPFVTDSNPPSYNGYTFPVSVETTSFDSEPQMDEANRVILYVKHRITLKWSVNAAVGFNIDTTMATLRSTLMQRGEEFNYENRGFGADWSINGTGSFTDVAGGPIPTNFSFRPMGKNQGAQCSWTVEVCVPSNCAAFNVQGVLMTFNYRLRISIDPHGYSTRTYTGHIAIPKIAGDDNATVADGFLDSVIPNIPTGFNRTTRDYDHSFDKKRIDFVVIDEELSRRALPPGCTAASASHEINSSPEGGFQQWFGSITGSYTVAPMYKPDVAWLAFFDLLSERLNFARLNFIAREGPENQEQGKPKEKGQAFLLSLSMSEPEIYGINNVRFQVTYSQICSLEDILGDGFFKAGLWRYVSEGPAAWQLWASSITDIQRPRGLANLGLAPGNEVLVDLCLRDNATPPQMEADFSAGDILPMLGDLEDLQPEPDIDASWFYYIPEIEIYEDSHAIVSSSLVEEPWNPYDQSPELFGQGYTADPKPNEPTDQVQYRSPSTLIIYIAGEALRAWFPIHRPKIISWNGLQVKEVSTIADGCFWRSKPVANLGLGAPVYYAEWRFKYVVEARPAEPITPPQSRSDQF